jgi:hypothetical protein
MGTILENHTLHIIKEDNTSEQLTGVMIQVNENESVFHVRAAKNCSIPPVIKSVCPRCGGKLINTEQYGWFCPDIACRIKGQTVL